MSRGMSAQAIAPEGKDDKAAAEADVAAAMPKKKSGITIFLILNSALLAGVLAMQVLKPGAHAATPAAEGGHGEKAEAPAKAEAAAPAGAPRIGPGPMVRMADFIVHLRNPEAERYARISFEIEVGAELDKDKLNARLPQIRESFISFLSDQTLEDLRGSDGIKKTKDQLYARLAAIAPEASPRGIYITDLVIQ